MPQVGTSQVIRFATFEVDLQAQELRKGGLRLKLTGQPFQVLAILLEQPGVIVTREELQKRLWPDTFVDVDHNLNTAINKIREALSDSPENPRFVETLPRRGYRFIAPVDGRGEPGQAAEKKTSTLPVDADVHGRPSGNSDCGPTVAQTRSKVRRSGVVVARAKPVDGHRHRRSPPGWPHARAHAGCSSSAVARSARPAAASAYAGEVRARARRGRVRST